MSKYLTSLYNYKLKKFGFISASIMLVLDLGTYFIGNLKLENYDHHILFHYIILLSLVTVATSKDKMDDELSRKIRYSVFKITLTITSLIAGISALLLSVFDINSVPTLVVLYYFEGMFVIHIVLYYIGYRWSPKWLLREEEAPGKSSQAAKRLMIALIICVFLILIFSIIAELSGEI